MADGDQGSLAAAALDDALVAGAEEGVGPGGGQRGLADGALDPRVALAGGAGRVLASRLHGPWRELRPRDEMVGGGEDSHVRAEFGEQYLGGPHPDARD